MRYPVIIVSDLHLTSKETDRYRWGLFPWLREKIKQNGIKELYILGDLTDAKDRHTSLLVNDLVSALAIIAKMVPIKIIKGNHDYIDANNPFMEFVNNIPNIEFYTTWASVSVPVSRKTNKNVLFLPHTRKHNYEWAVIEFSEYDYIFMHQTVNGSVAANGFELEEGMSSNYFGRKAYSGDIHVPQVIGNVEYIGAPYPIRFGDSYKGRALMLDLFNGSQEDLHYETIKKEVINIKAGESIKDFELKEGDMVKLRIHLRKADFHKWEHLKKEYINYLLSIGVICDAVEVKELKRVVLRDSETKNIVINTKTPDSMLEGYAAKENVGEEVLEVGRSYL